MANDLKIENPISAFENNEIAIVKPNENRTIAVADEKRIPLATFDINNASDAMLEAISNAPQMNFNTKAEYWTPENKGERKRLIFQFIAEKEKTKNTMSEDPEYVFLDVAYFVELKKDEKTGKMHQQMLKNASTVMVSYLQNNYIPKHAILDVEYQGKKRSKKGGFSFDDFAFIPVPVQF